jgi:hypothetical protein
MKAKVNSQVLNKVNVETILEQLSISKENKEELTWRLLEIRDKSVAWEINNPLGHNLFIVKVNFTDDVIKENTIPPSIDKIVSDYNLMRKSASKSITDIIPKHTSLLFSTLNDVMVYSQHAGGELLKSYYDINFLMHLK